MKLMHIRTIHDKDYTVPVANKRHAARVLMNLQRMGVLCKWWKYEEATP